MQNNSESDTSLKVTDLEFPKVLDGFAPDWSGRHVGFVHISKTASTSFTAALALALGVRPLVLTNHDWFDPNSRTNLDRFSFWPFIASHQAVRGFPGSHQLVTVFREPRSRLLSAYRHDQRVKSLSGLALEPIDNFLADRRIELMSHYFTAVGVGFGALSNLDAPGRLAEITASLKLLTAACWSHDGQGMEKVIEGATGRHARLSHLNSGAGYDYELMKVDVRKLDEAAQWDQILVDLAASLGLVSRLDSSQADQILWSTAESLSFDLF